MNLCKVLILDGNSIQSLPFIESYNKLDCEVTIICPWKFSIGWFSRYAHKKIIFCNIHEKYNEYSSLFIDHIKNNDYDLVLSLSDITMKLVAENYDIISQYSKVIIPKGDSYKKASDKLLTMKHCMSENISCPITINPDEENILSTYKYPEDFPLILKPRQGVGARGIVKVNNIEEFNKLYKKHKIRFGSLLLQERVHSFKIQYQALAYCNSKSKMIACVVVAKTRYYPIDGGTGTCSMTVKEPKIQSIAKNLLEGLGWIGAADIDILFDLKNNKYKIIEINPRVPSNIKIAFKAGIDFAQLYLSEIENIAIKPNYKYLRGIVLRNLLTEMLWLLKSNSKMRKETYPAFFKFFGKKIFYTDFSLKDPLPFLGFLYGKFIKKFEPLF